MWWKYLSGVLIALIFAIAGIIKLGMKNKHDIKKEEIKNKHDIAKTKLLNKISKEATKNYKRTKSDFYNKNGNNPEKILKKILEENNQNKEKNVKEQEKNIDKEVN